MTQDVLRRLTTLSFIHAFDAELPNLSRFNMFERTLRIVLISDV